MNLKKNYISIWHFKRDYKLRIFTRNFKNHDHFTKFYISTHILKSLKHNHHVRDWVDLHLVDLHSGGDSAEEIIFIQ